VFFSLYFQRFWPKWLNFFLSFQKRFGIWLKKHPGAAIAGEKFGISGNLSNSGLRVISACHFSIKWQINNNHCGKTSTFKIYSARTRLGCNHLWGNHLNNKGCGVGGKMSDSNFNSDLSKFPTPDSDSLA